MFGGNAVSVSHEYVRSEGQGHRHSDSDKETAERHPSTECNHQEHLYQ